VTVERHATVFADGAQFYVQDPGAYTAAMRAGAAMDPDRPAGGWTKTLRNSIGSAWNRIRSRSARRVPTSWRSC
jgi:hypothetical protein